MKLLPRWIGPVLGTIGLTLLLVSSAGAQSVDQEISTYRQKLADARSERLDLIAPGAFATAEKEMAQAVQRFERGGRIEDIQKRLAKVQEALDKCSSLKGVGDVLLAEAFAARGDAITAEAEDFAPSDWADAEKSMQSAGREVESGDQKGARKKAVETVELYRTAEFHAIREALLSDAGRERDRALELKADEWARGVFARATSALQKADGILKTDRYRKDEARTLAQQARDEFRHAALIAKRGQKIEQDRKVEVEAFSLEHEKQLAKIASALGYTPNFSEGTAPVLEQLLSAIEGVSSDRNSLSQRVANQKSEIEALTAQIGKLQSRDEALQEKERWERRLATTREVFALDDADVLQNENKVIIRLYGLTFPVSSSEILPQNFAVLTRVKRAIEQFPQAFVTIEGHTDSQGDEDRNLNLSERRAEAVRGYLMANMDIATDRILTRGFGENRPVASNETEDGRRRNRRIEVVLDLSGGSR